MTIAIGVFLPIGESVSIGVELSAITARWVVHRIAIVVVAIGQAITIDVRIAGIAQRGQVTPAEIDRCPPGAQRLGDLQAQAAAGPGHQGGAAGQVEGGGGVGHGDALVQENMTARRPRRGAYPIAP